MNVAAVYACVKLLSESVATLPLQYLRRKDGLWIEDTTSRLAYLLSVQPDTCLSSFDMMRQATQNILLDGNAYIIPFFDGPEISRLALCGRGTVSHDTLNDTYNVSDAINGIYGTFREDAVIHLKALPGPDGKRGVSVLTNARLTTGIATVADKETQKRFANGGTVKGLVSNDTSLQGYGEYQDVELEKLAENLNYRFNIAGENILASPGQTAFTQISMSSVDMQFLESRKFTVREICRFFGVHPSFIFDDTSNNYKSAEQANVAFLSHTLNPLLRCIESEFNRKLIAPSLFVKRQFRFDRRGLHACDLEGLMKYRVQQLQTGTTVNEVRLMDNLPPVPGGDTVMVSANLKGINEINNAPAGNVDKKDNDEE